MVAVRQTHVAAFDFEKWSDNLNLPEQDRVKLHKTHLFALEKLGPKDQHKAEKMSRMSAEIVGILMTLNMDLESLTVSFLYPVYAAGRVSKEEIEEKFGPGPAKLLQSVRHMEAIKFLQNLNLGSVTESQVDRVRRMLLSMVDDVRAVVIKLAERIAVIREVKNESEEVRLAVAREVANIFAPLANRLGIGQLKWELEDLAFRCLHPKSYRHIADCLGEKRVVREEYINKFVSTLKDLLTKEGIKGEVYGRPKHIYSIWRKMQKKHLEFTELYDVRAVRVVLDNLTDCYEALSVIHSRWQHIPKEFDDYIANPKPNGYQSIHTVVLGDGNKPVEIQIRTEAMHKAAELGVAAHWKYKEGAGQASGAEERINFLRKLLAWRDDMVESGALLDEFRRQVFEDRVYVFTPRGEVLDLPTGATPLDFAYHVHTMVGHRCIGAKVNGRIVPYTYELKTGDSVEIITQKEPNPSRDWLKADNGFLKTAKARSKVQVWFRKIDYDSNIAAGKEIIEREILRGSLGISREQAVSLLKEKLTRFNVRSVDDILAGLGGGDIKAGQVISCLQEGLSRKSSEQDKEDNLKDLIVADSKAQAKVQKRLHKNNIVIAGVGNMMTRLARCCQPIPGDLIAGFITQGRGVSIHRTDCRQLRDLGRTNPGRLIDAQWSDANAAAFSITVRITAPDYSGLLRDITTVIANEKINVLGVRSRIDKKKDLSIIDIDLLVNKVDSLERTLKKIKENTNAMSVERL